MWHSCPPLWGECMKDCFQVCCWSADPCCISHCTRSYCQHEWNEQEVQQWLQILSQTCGNSLQAQGKNGPVWHQQVFATLEPLWFSWDPLWVHLLIRCAQGIQVLSGSGHIWAVWQTDKLQMLSVFFSGLREDQDVINVHDNELPMYGANILFMVDWNVAGAFVRPKHSTLNS